MIQRNSIFLMCFFSVCGLNMLGCELLSYEQMTQNAVTKVLNRHMQERIHINKAIESARLTQFLKDAQQENIHIETWLHNLPLVMDPIEETEIRGNAVVERQLFKELLQFETEQTEHEGFEWVVVEEDEEKESHDDEESQSQGDIFAHRGLTQSTLNKQYATLCDVQKAIEQAEAEQDNPLIAVEIEIARKYFEKKLANL
ncbi:MAG TPA: hypothetical protein VLG50_07285 [Candidatus Saccharimonadales bacterium]|nr:hypothetical protein [Candidatus Saccharimonadales bacterium]